MSFVESLAAATQAATCNWLNNGGNAALTTAIVGGALTPGGQVPALAAGLGLLAMNSGCSFDPAGGGPQVAALPSNACTEAATGTLTLQAVRPDGTKYAVKSGLRSVGSIAFARKETCAQPCSRWEYTAVLADGAPFSGAIVIFDNETFTTTLSAGGTCKSVNGGTTGTLGPVEYTDATTNCTYVVEHLAWDVGTDGVVAPVVKISAGGPAARATGGVIGGCNFSPVIHYGGGGGGPVIPWTPGPDVDGEPWWVPLVRGAAGGVAGSVTSKLLDAIFGEKTAADVYRLVSVCEQDAQGEPVSQERRVDLAAAPILNGIVKRLDAMEVLMQGLKDFKQPTCSGPRPQGELVTVNFISRQKPPDSSAYLRKYMRYRDATGASEAEHIAHWEGFEWEAGPAIVASKGASWGIVSVWAADPEEGRRVIRHAAAIAGVDLTAKGHSFVDSSPQSSRYGRSGLMAVERTREGVPCISKRSGPSGRPSWALSQ